MSAVGMRPRGAVSDGRAKVLAALALPGCWSVRRVAVATGLNVSNVYRHLLVLREQGMVAWEPNRSGTLRRLYKVGPPHGGPR